MKSKVDFLKDEELYAFKKVIVRTGRLRFIFNRQGVVLPPSKGQVNCEVEIVFCRAGHELKFKIKDEEGTIVVVKSESLITSIWVGK